MQFPKVIFGSATLGNLFSAPPQETKLALVKAWLDAAPDEDSPVVIDSAGKYGAGLSLECIGNCLRELGADPERVVINNKLGWYRVPLTTPEPTFEPGAWIDLEHDAEQRISRQGILDCWEQGSDLLGAPFKSKLASVHDPDEFLAAATDADDKEARRKDLFEAYESLAELKAKGEVEGLGIGCKDWRIAKEITDQIDLDWMMIANCLTVYEHPPELIAWIESLASKGVTVINSAVFNAGFLVGGKFYNYRELLEDSPEDQKLFAWRERFFALCEKHGVEPAAACVRFGMSPPGVASIAVGTSKPERVAEFIRLTEAEIGNDFWDEARSDGLIDPNYQHVPLND